MNRLNLIFHMEHDFLKGNFNTQTGGVNASPFILEGGTLSDAIITGIVAICVCIINNWVQYNKTKQETDKTVALIQAELATLSDRVNRHNQIVERTYKLEESTALQDAELKRVTERLKVVEGKTA